MPQAAPAAKSWPHATPLESARYYAQDLTPEVFTRLGKLDEDGGQMIAEAFNILYMLWTNMLDGVDPGDREATARIVADVGHRLRTDALTFGLIDKLEGEDYVRPGPTLARTGEAIEACRLFLEHSRQPQAKKVRS